MLTSFLFASLAFSVIFSSPSQNRERERGKENKFERPFRKTNTIENLNKKKVSAYYCFTKARLHQNINPFLLFSI